MFGRLRYRIAICLLLAIVESRKVEAQPRIHVITVADTMSEDVAIPAGTSTFWVARQLLEQSPPELLTITELRDNDFSRETVIKTIRELPTGPDDAIFYYYVGHGFYDGGTFFAPLADRKKYFYLREIHEAMRMKKVRLTVSVSDCCSQRPIGGAAAPAPSEPNPRRPANLSPLLEQLFLRSSGEYSINSSKPGEYALCALMASPDTNGSGRSLLNVSTFSGAWTKVAGIHQQRRLEWKDFVLGVKAETVKGFDVLKDPSIGKVRLGNGKYLDQDTQTTWANHNGKSLVPF